MRCFLTCQPMQAQFRESLSLFSQKKTPKSLCGLGSWHEQQQDVDVGQKTILLLDKTTQKSGCSNRHQTSGCHSRRLIVYTKIYSCLSFLINKDQRSPPSIFEANCIATISGIRPPKATVGNTIESTPAPATFEPFALIIHDFDFSF